MSQFPHKYLFEMIFTLTIVIVVFINLSISVELRKVLSDIFAKYEERLRPAEIDVTIIKDDNCEYCYDIEKLIGEIETENAKIRTRKSLDYRNEEARKYISKYHIEKVPAMIMQGDIGKNDNLFKKLKDVGEITDEVLTFKEPSMPYVDIRSGFIVGNVKVTLMSAKNCGECYNFEKYIAELKILGIPTANREIVDYETNAGRMMIKEKAIDRVPTFILAGDLARYPALKKIQDYDDNVFVLRNVINPYLNLNDGKVYNVDVLSE